jgi:hypothetical protein
LLCLAAGIALLGRPSLAAEAKPANYHSPSIFLQTDLEPEVAKQLCEQLEKTAEQLAAEFGKPTREPITVLVIKHLARWPADAIPDDARKQIEARAGATITERLTEDGKLVSIRSTVYSCADGRTPQHELTHAYCWQAFGRVGPDWFAEGTAERFANRSAGPTGVQAPRYILEYLRTDPSPPTPEAIVADQLGDRKLWQKYAHRWALCYLLSHDPDYSVKFREYGRALLNGKDVDFLSTLNGELEGLNSAYQQFLRNGTLDQ